MKHTLPKISVTIPLITGGDASIVLHSLKAVKYPKQLIEIFIIEGNHIAKQRNIGLKCSTGEIIYLLDNDSEVHPQAFRLLAKIFANPKVAAVGGPSLISPHHRGYFHRVIAMTLETYFGAMRMRFRYSQQKNHSQSAEGSEYQLLGANLALRRKTVVKIGGFNEKIVPNEETELLRRLKNHRYTILYNNDLFIYRPQRKNLWELSRQFQHYGKGRMKQITHEYQQEDLLFLLPIGFGSYVLTTPFFHPLWYLLPIAGYLLLALLTSLKASYKYRRLDIVITMPIVFPIIHLSYTVGLISEVWNHFFTKRRGGGQDLLEKPFTVQAAKAFISTQLKVSKNTP